MDLLPQEENSFDNNYVLTSLEKSGGSAKLDSPPGVGCPRAGIIPSCGPDLFECCMVKQNLVLPANSEYFFTRGILMGSNVVLDCNGATIRGNFTGGYGIDAANANNVTIKNCNIEGFGHGIEIGTYCHGEGSQKRDFNILNNNITNNSLIGICLKDAQNVNN